MALRVVDWDLCMMTMLDLLAQPDIRTRGGEICGQAVESGTKHAFTLMTKY